MILVSLGQYLGNKNHVGAKGGELVVLTLFLAVPTEKMTGVRLKSGRLN